MMRTDECIALYRKFPFLFHNEDFTEWFGYLPVKGSQIRVKISTPFYPHLKDITFDCPPNLVKIFRPNLKYLLNCETLWDFVLIIYQILNNEFQPEPTETFVDYQKTLSLHSMLSELEEAVHTDNILKISDDFKNISVKYTDAQLSEHILQFSIPNDYPKGSIIILEADLPNEILSGFSKISSIRKLYQHFKESVDALIPFWKVCKTLEEKAWVIDPPNPKKRDVYRRIRISDTLSVLLNFNPLDARSCPDVKFMGSMKAAEEARLMYLQNLQVYGWIKVMDVAENIASLLGLPQLPMKSQEDTNSLDSDTSLDNCYICYTYMTDDEEPPAKWCNNDNCSTCYHQSCLLQWLQTVVTSVRLLDHISGPCPYCNEKLWCPLNTNQI